MAIYALEDRILFDAAGPGDSDVAADSTLDGENAPIESESTSEQQSTSEKENSTDKSDSSIQPEDKPEQEEKKTSSQDSTTDKPANDPTDTSTSESGSNEESDQAGSVASAESTREQDLAAETEPSDSDSQTDPKPLSGEDVEKEQKNEIAFVSDSLTDKETIIEALEEEEVEVVVVDSTDSGLDVISETLAEQQDIVAVHIFSHGGDGHFTLGTDVINSAALEANKEQVQSWSTAIAKDGDINLYGCKIGENASGKAFVNRLSELTQADVAASTDDTGSPSTGGDWQLEYTTGVVSSTLSMDKVQTASLLPTYTVNSLDDNDDGV